MNKDRLNMANPFETLRAAYAFVSAAQDHPPEQQVAGIAVVFRMMCDRLGLDMSTELARAQMIERDANTHYAANVRAMHDYIDQEIKNR